MSRLDPRAQLAWLLAVVLGATFGGEMGLAAGAVLALATLVAAGALGMGVKLLLALAPLALLVVLADMAVGRLDEGVRIGARLLVLALVGTAFARAADAERLVAALRWLRVPFAVSFVLVAGARFVPTTLRDLSDLRDAGRLRGIAAEGPPWQRIAAWRVLLVPLLIATIRRGLQLGEAMEARGFDPNRPRTLRHNIAWRLRDWAALFLAVGYVAGVALASRAGAG